MPQVPQTTSQTHTRDTVELCVEYARAKGLRGIQMDRRIHFRLPFVYPVRFAVGSEPDYQQSLPGYALDISFDGISIWCRESLSVDEHIHVRLPLPDGTEAWLPSRVVHCEPDAEHYRAGLVFADDDGSS